MVSGRTGWSRLASRAWHPQPSGIGISGQGRAAHSTAQPLHLFMHRPSRAVLQLLYAAARPSQPAPPSSTSSLQGTRRRPTQKSRHTPARPGHHPGAADQHHHPPRRQLWLEPRAARGVGGLDWLAGPPPPPPLLSSPRRLRPTDPALQLKPLPRKWPTVSIRAARTASRPGPIAVRTVRIAIAAASAAGTRTVVELQ